MTILRDAVRRTTLIGILVAPLAPTALTAQAPSIRAEIEARVDALLAAFRAGDTRAVAQMFRDDASILGPAGLRVVGRAAIDSYWVARPRPTSWAIETLEVGGSRDAPWHYARSIRVNSSAARADTSVTTFLLIWKRGSDGTLQIYLDLFT
jgi:ketosteroid isomerase-like protein